MESIKYGIQKPKGDFDRRGVDNNPCGGSMYKMGEQKQASGPGYVSGNSANNPKGSANFATQKKSKGLTGTTQGSGPSNFKAKGKTSNWSGGSSMSQRKGFGGQKKGR